MIRPSIFLDADAMFAGAASPREYGASHVILRLGQYTILDCVTSEQAIAEVERNLSLKAPSKVGTFRAIIRDCLRVVPDPEDEQIEPFAEMADAGDLPMLVAAVSHGAHRLITFNVRHYWPQQISFACSVPANF
jgi:hypothetical protein